MVEFCDKLNEQVGEQKVSQEHGEKAAVKPPCDGRESTSTSVEVLSRPHTVGKVTGTEKPNVK